MAVGETPQPPADASHAPTALDGRRGMAAQKSTMTRRRERLQKIREDQLALRRRQEVLETLLLAAPAKAWSGAAAKAIYLIQLYAAAPEASEPLRKRLIEQAHADLQRLSGQDDLAGPEITQ